MAYKVINKAAFEKILAEQDERSKNIKVLDVLRLEGEERERVKRWMNSHQRASAWFNNTTPKVIE